jgi:hypothetical protein
MNADLHDALRAWQGETLPDERTEELLERLRVDDALRQEFSEQIWTMATAQIAQAPEPRWLAVMDEMGARPPATTKDSDECVMARIRSRPSRFVRAWWQWSALGSLGVTAVLAVFFTLNEPVAKEPKPASVVPLAQIISRQGSIAPRIGETIGKGPFVLTAGRTMLRFDSGVTLDLAGPIHIDILGVDSVRLHSGQLRMEAPPGAEGFAIETHDGIITDLGTELAVNSAPSRPTRMMVLEGKAEAAVFAPGTRARRTMNVVAGQAVEIDGGATTIRESDTTGFLPNSEIETRPLSIHPEYPAAVMAARPSHYWRLNRLVDGKVPNEISASPALKLMGMVKLSADSGGSISAMMAGDRNAALVSERLWLMPEQDRAVEMWFAITSFEDSALASFTAPENNGGLVFLLETKRFTPYVGRQIRCLSRWPAGHGGGMNTHSEAEDRTSRWCHVVAQTSKGRMELYLDGKLEGEAQAEMASGSFPALAQFGNLLTSTWEDRTTNLRQFGGRIAEIALYDHALSPEEIRKHARLGGIAE